MRYISFDCFSLLASFHWDVVNFTKQFLKQKSQTWQGHHERKGDSPDSKAPGQNQREGFKDAQMRH